MDILFDIFEAQYVIFFIVGFIMLAIGIVIAVYEKRIKMKSTRLAGYYSGVAKEMRTGSKNGSTFYYSLVTFTDPHGKEIEFKTRVGSSAVPDPKKIGTPVTVLYNEGDAPKVDGMAMYVLSAILIGIGVLFAGIYIVNFEFNWAAALFSIGIITFAIVKLLQVLSKIESVKKASSLSIAINALVNEAQKSMKEQETRIGSGHAKMTKEDFTKLDTQAIKIEQRKQQAPTWVGIVLGLVAIGMFIGGFISYQNQSVFLETALLEQGKIIAFKESSDSDGNYTYAPTIRFTVKGKSIQFTDNMGSSHPSEKVGDIVTVLYNPADYHDAQMDKGWLNWILPIILFPIGLILLYAAIYILRQKSKK